ncbi:MAG: DinB family protein [Bacteroidota bacterium]
MEDFRQIYLRDVLRTYRNYKALGEKALAQIPDARLHTELDANSNSAAVIVKHVAGNLRSRFRDFLTSDGEKPDRDRDSEFEMVEQASRAQILEWWERGWTTALTSIEALRPEDLERTIRIRNEPFAVVEALNRSVTHTAYHVGQIVYLARHLAGPSWTTLSIPKGKSREHVQGEFKNKGIVR